MVLKRKRGATLGLVIATTFLLSIVGIAIVFFCLLLGGARELQNATDSGNLNVAKQSLRYPSLNVFGNGNLDLSGPRLQEVQTNFSQDKDVNGQLDLLTFNRCVGQVMLVAMNASVDNGPNNAAVRNARNLINLITDNQQGIGTLLANKLATDHQMDLNFSNLAQIASLRMLSNPNGYTNTTTAAKEASYMVPSTASNLVVDPGSIPPAFLASDPGFLTNNFVNQAGGTYLKGYSFISIPSITDNANYPLMGVPLCPTLKPHLISLTDFNAQRVSPLPAGGATASRVPPNSFKSGGNGLDGHPQLTLGSISCSLAGSLTSQYLANIPCGFIVVANGNGFTPTATPGLVQVDNNAQGLIAGAYGGNGRDIFSDVLMYNTVFVTADGAMTENPQVIIDIQNFKAANPGQPVPANLANALDGPSPKQTYADGIQVNETPAACTNLNSSAGAMNPNSQCIANLPSMASVYNSNLPQAGAAGTLTGLMDLEKEKAEVIDPRPWGGPALVSGVNGACTGLKNFPAGGIPASAPVNFGTLGTLGSLVSGFSAYPASAGAESQIYSALLLKINQIKPKISGPEVQAIMNTPIPMGSIMFIWMDDSQGMHVTTAAGLPSWINPNNVLPDGSTTTALTGAQGVFRSYVDILDEQGFPSPWDCPGGPASYQNEMQWTNSSGFNCLQGVLRFQNCANDGGQPWKCPC